MNKLELLKDAADLVVSIGVSSIVGNTIKLVKNPNDRFYKRAAVAIGGVVLSSMISDKAGEYTTKRIDRAAESINKILHPVPTITDVESVGDEKEDDE